MSNPKSPFKNPKKPHVSRELLAWLKEHFPDRLPDLDTPDRKIWFERGRVEVIRHLQSLYDAQETT